MNDDLAPLWSLPYLGSALRSMRDGRREGMLPVKKLVVGPRGGSTGPPHGEHRSARPYCRRCAPGLNRTRARKSMSGAADDSTTKFPISGKVPLEWLMHRLECPSPGHAQSVVLE
ncbi:hypothetical protein V6N13_116972 [Hibiscus sabdariffa]